jgi:hypothetical protein
LLPIIQVARATKHTQGRSRQWEAKTLDAKKEVDRGASLAQRRQSG